jgi:hypothetical protein
MGYARVREQRAFSQSARPRIDAFRCTKAIVKARKLTLFAQEAGPAIIEPVTGGSLDQRLVTSAVIGPRTPVQLLAP